MEIFGISYFNENSRMVVQNVELHTKNGAVLDADGNIQTAKIAVLCVV